MNSRLIFIILAGLLFAGQAFAAGEPGVKIVTSARGGIVTVERVIDNGKVVLSVSNPEKGPVLGLTSSDFSVALGEKAGKIISVTPLAESQDVPRNIVLVLDNSDSMRQRHAIEPLREGVDELLKIVRPIDRVRIVTFAKKAVTSLGGHDVEVQTFTSKEPARMKDFVAGSYSEGITSRTVLYDAMLVGLDLIREMPQDEPRFMVVFSDGEDLNSFYKEKDIFLATPGVGRFHAYGIDFMPGVEKDKFLMEFAERNDGQLWKATSETNLVPIFQSVASKMQHYYVVSYLFPTTGSLKVAPAGLTIDDVENFDAAAATAPAVARRIDASELTLSPMIDTVYSIANWKTVVANTSGEIAVQSGEGAPASEIRMPIKTDDLDKIVAGGDISATMEVRDSKGQTIILSAAPVKVSHFTTTGSLMVAPTSLNIDDVKNFDATAASSPAMAQRIDTSWLTLTPKVNTGYGLANWKAIVSNTSGVIALQTGEGAPASEIRVPIKTDDLNKLVTGGDISVTMELRDNKGQTIMLTALPVKVNHFTTTGSLAVAPTSLNIEEIKTIDSSPMLAYIYFEEGSSDIPAKYVRLSGIAGTATFDEQSFRGTLEKYYQVLNIIGKRLTARPEATITIVGCNSDTGPEKNKKKLSSDRAQAVSDYLQTIWNIAPWRMRMEARNLPAKPSTRNLKEGQAENRRVEIHSTDLEVLAPIRSVYMTMQINTSALKLHSEVVSPHGIASWKITASNTGGILTSLEGKGSPTAETDMSLDTGKLEALATGGDIALKMELKDNNGQIITLSPAPVKVNFIRTSQRMSEKLDQKVQEKYALILFDFDKDSIEAGNQAIVDKIVARIHELPQAAVDIVGHTDIIGKEAYNIKLSERRALAVYKILTAATGETSNNNIHQSGVGPNSPLYDNMSPEARAFNRTVTIKLEYMQKD